MDVIYEPKGPALEYAHLAINIYKGCKFACTYCYAPDMARMNMADWSRHPEPKKGILERIEKDAKKIAGDPRSILLCFTCDPYQSIEAARLTRRALLILEKHKLTATVLTKAGLGAAQDFDILKRNKWEFGTTICCTSDALRMQWEPNAEGIKSRCLAIKHAHEMGIKTWVSMEPVYDAPQALKLIERIADYVDFWKVGKMNHRKLNIDWPRFREDAILVLDNNMAKYYIKKELEDAR